MSLTLKGAVKNTGWLALEQVIRLLASLVVSGLIARQLGPAAFGWLSFAGSIVAVLTPIAGLGLNEVIARRIFRADAEGERSALGTGIRMRLLAGLILWAVVATVAAGLKADNPTVVLIVICSGALVMQAPGVLDAYFQVRLQHGSAVLRRLAGFGLTITVKVVLLAIQAPLWAFALSTVFDVLVTSLSLLVAMGPEAKVVLRQRFSEDEARQLLKLSWPLISSGVLIALYFRIEQFIVLNALGEHDYGVYMAAVRMVAVVNLVIPPMMASLFPLLAEKAHQQKIRPGEVPDSFVHALAIFSLGACGLAVLVAGGGWLFVEWVLGPEYASSKIALIVLPFGIPAIVSGGVRVHYLNITRQNNLHNWAAIMGLFLNVVLALALVPTLNLAGASLASVLSAYASAIGSSWIFPDCRSFGVAQLKAFMRLSSLKVAIKKLKQLI